MTQHLSPLSLQALYIISVLGDSVSNSDILEILQKENIDVLRIVLIMRNLVEQGILFSMDNSHLGFRLNADIIAPLLGDQREVLDDNIARYVYQAILEGRWKPLEDVFWIIAPRLSHEHYLSILILTVYYLLDCLQNPLPFLRHCWMDCDDKVLRSQIQILQTITWIEWKLITGKDILEYDNEQLFHINQGTLSEELYALVNTTQSRVALHQKNSVVATARAKVVLALSLSPITIRLHGLCYVVLGALAMLRGKYREASDYFLFVENMKDQHRSLLSRALAEIYLCSCYFLTGHLAQLQDQTERSQQSSMHHGQHQWHQLYTFLRARTMFELGYYQDARSLFEQHPPGSLDRLSLMWAGRSLAYLGLFTPAVNQLSSLPSSAERNLFLGEAYVFSHHFQQAKEILEEGIELVKTESFFSSPPLVIPNGFFVLVGMSSEMTGRELFRLLHVMYAYTLACMGKRDESMEILEPFIPHHRDLEKGPYDPEIYFLSAEISFMGGQTEQRSVAYLSKGIVVLKERASMLHKAQLKDQYLFHHYWHSRLMQKAKDYYIA